MEVIVSKQRYGPTGTIHFKFGKEYGRYVEGGVLSEMEVKWIPRFSILNYPSCLSIHVIMNVNY